MGRSRITFLHKVIAEGAPKLLLSLVTAAQEAQELVVETFQVIPAPRITHVTRCFRKAPGGGGHFAECPLS